ESAPKQTEYLVRLATFLYQKRNRPVQAQEMLDRARKLAPKDASVLLLAATLAQGRGDKKNVKEAERFLALGRKIYPNDPRFYQALARLKVSQENRDQAVKDLRAGFKALPGQTHAGLHWTIANLLLDDNKQAEAEKEIAMLRQANISPAAVDYLRARLC